jgi:hypothetical protein
MSNVGRRLKFVIRLLLEFSARRTSQAKFAETVLYIDMRFWMRRCDAREIYNLDHSRAMSHTPREHLGDEFLVAAEDARWLNQAIRDIARYRLPISNCIHKHVHLKVLTEQVFVTHEFGRNIPHSHD